MHFTVKSDLNGNSPQFTLTCISTGGPATTVTWTRDSEKVTGGMTVLNNTESAQYTHTLTVTGRLPGQYRCNVSNNKPSTATKSFTMQGDVRVLGYMQCFTSISYHKTVGKMCYILCCAFLLLQYIHTTVKHTAVTISGRSVATTMCAICP